MQTIGILGGLSWESTALYYRLLNRGVAARCGGLNSARCIINSFNNAEIVERESADDWATVGRWLGDGARALEDAGADVVLLAVNTCHHVADVVESAIRVPFIHIVDPTCRAIQQARVRTVGLLGTRYTMELPFWRERASERFGVEVIVPIAEDRATVSRVIYEELSQGIVDPGSRRDYVGVIERLGDAGADAVVLGCTELALLLSQADSPLPLFDTTALHVQAALDVALAGD